MSAHTKGPWIRSPYNRWGVFDEQKRPVAVAHDGVHSFDIPDDEREANVNLISAAPELLEALEDLVSVCDEGDGSAYTNARAAIRKATEGK